MRVTYERKSVKILFVSVIGKVSHCDYEGQISLPKYYLYR